MSDTPVDNRKVNVKPAINFNIDNSDSGLFSKKIDSNIWEAVSKTLKPDKPGNGVQFQIFKTTQETQKYEEILSNANTNKLDYNC